MAFPPTATFGQLFPFQMSFEAKLFSLPETVVVWLTQQQKVRTQMTMKATGLCTNLKIWNCTHAPTKNARKRPQTERNGHCPC